MNNAINEIKNTLEATNSRITEAENRISGVEDRMVEINEWEKKKEKLIKTNEDNLRDLQDNNKRYNIRIIGQADPLPLHHLGSHRKQVKVEPIKIARQAVGFFSNSCELLF